jgi:hypothetical protein
MNAIAMAKYSSESLGRISIGSLERVFPLEVRGVVSRRFKVGNTAGEYTECRSSPHSMYSMISMMTAMLLHHLATDVTSVPF